MAMTVATAHRLAHDPDQAENQQRIDPKEHVDEENLMERRSPNRTAQGGKSFKESNGEPDHKTRQASTEGEQPVPTFEELAPYRDDEACTEWAQAVEDKWPHLKRHDGFYYESGEPADHAWNKHPNGTIVDSTAQQFGNPEIVTPDMPQYANYISYTEQPAEAQALAHHRGEHYDGPEAFPTCPTCNPLTQHANELAKPHAERKAQDLRSSKLTQADIPEGEEAQTSGHAILPENLGGHDGRARADQARDGAEHSEARQAGISADHRDVGGNRAHRGVRGKATTPRQADLADPAANGLIHPRDIQGNGTWLCPKGHQQPREPAIGYSSYCEGCKAFIPREHFIYYAGNPALDQVRQAAGIRLDKQAPIDPRLKNQPFLPQDQSPTHCRFCGHLLDAHPGMPGTSPNLKCNNTTCLAYGVWVQEPANVQDSAAGMIQNKLRQAAQQPRYIHTTDKEFAPGDILRPPSETGHESEWSHIPQYDPNSVYLWDQELMHNNPDGYYYQHTDDPTAGYRHYEVEPMGEVRPDPEAAEFLGTEDEAFYHPYWHTTPQARVIREVDPEELYQERLRLDRHRHAARQASPIEMIESQIPGWEEEDKFLAHRRPFHYWPDLRLMYLGQPGTHHDVIDDEMADPDGDVAQRLRQYGAHDRNSVQGQINLEENLPPEYQLDPENPRTLIDYNRFGNHPDEEDVVNTIRTLYPQAEPMPKQNVSARFAASDSASPIDLAHGVHESNEDNPYPAPYDPKVLDQIRQRAADEYGMGELGTGCFDVAPAVQEKYPEAQVESGTFAGDGHVWNRLPDGSILDATYRQHVTPEHEDWENYHPGEEPVYRTGQAQHQPDQPSLPPTASLSYVRVRHRGDCTDIVWID